VITLHHNIYDRHDIEWLPPTDLQVKEAQVLTRQLQRIQEEADAYEDSVSLTRKALYYA
jgi:hypothetical protein